MLWLVRDEASYVERWHHCIRPLMDIFLFIKNCFTLLKYSLSYELVNKLVCFEQFSYKHVPDISGQYRYFIDSLQFDSTSNQTAFCFSRSCFFTAHSNFSKSHSSIKGTLSHLLRRQILFQIW